MEVIKSEEMRFSDRLIEVRYYFGALTDSLDIIRKVLENENTDNEVAKQVEGMIDILIDNARENITKFDKIIDDYCNK